MLGLGIYRTGERLWQHRQHRYDEVFQMGAEMYGIPTNLVKAVAWRESRFVADARGRHGELGLMQLTEIAAQEWADAQRNEAFVHDHVLDPSTNVMAACYYLSKLVKRYPETDNPWAYALADYNAGRSNVLRWMNDSAKTNSSAFLSAITYPSTRRYVLAVLNRYEQYESQTLMAVE
jgi:soluble lytic murein transglycosylase